MWGGGTSEGFGGWSARKGKSEEKRGLTLEKKKKKQPQKIAMTIQKDRPVTEKSPNTVYFNGFSVVSPVWALFFACFSEEQSLKSQYGSQFSGLTSLWLCLRVYWESVIYSVRMGTSANSLGRLCTCSNLKHTSL